MESKGKRKKRVRIKISDMGVLTDKGVVLSEDIERFMLGNEYKIENEAGIAYIPLDSKGKYARCGRCQYFTQWMCVRRIIEVKKSDIGCKLFKEAGAAK